MESTMTVLQAVALKNELEENVTKLMAEFEAKTGLTIYSIFTSRADWTAVRSEIKRVMVSAKAELL